MKSRRLRSCIVGGIAGAVAEFLVAVPATIADWRLNPGGIFQDEDGTHWLVLIETGLSWFLPVTLLIFLVADTAALKCLGH